MSLLHLCYINFPLLKISPVILQLHLSALQRLPSLTSLLALLSCWSTASILSDNTNLQIESSYLICCVLVLSQWLRAVKHSSQAIRSYNKEVAESRNTRGTCNIYRVHTQINILKGMLLISRPRKESFLTLPLSLHMEGYIVLFTLPERTKNKIAFDDNKKYKKREFPFSFVLFCKMQFYRRFCSIAKCLKDIEIEHAVTWLVNAQRV